MTDFASLGPGPAAAVTAALFGAVPDATIALTAGSADPAGPPVELALGAEFYTRQSISWAGSAGSWHNVEAAIWADLPPDTEVGGYVVLNATYSSLSNPLLWVSLALPVFAVSDSAFVIPAQSIRIQGFTTPE